MIKTSVSFNVVRSRLVQFSCDHILFQVPIRGEKKKKYTGDCRTQRKRESRKIVYVYKIQDTSFIYKYYLHIYELLSIIVKKNMFKISKFK